MSTLTETETPREEPSEIAKAYLRGYPPNYRTPAERATDERISALALENAQLLESLALFEQTDKLCEGGSGMAEMRRLLTENAQLRESCGIWSARNEIIKEQNAQLLAANRQLADAGEIAAQRLESLEPVHLNWHLAVGRIARAIRDALAGGAQ